MRDVCVAPWCLCLSSLSLSCLEWCCFLLREEDAKEEEEENEVEGLEGLSELDFVRSRSFVIPRRALDREGKEIKKGACTQTASVTLDNGAEEYMYMYIYIHANMVAGQIQQLTLA